MANGYNPFAREVSMTSLEKVMKDGANGNGITENGNNHNSKREVIVRGVLSVTVISAEELPAMDVMGKADPFVVVMMKKSGTKNKTRVRF